MGGWFGRFLRALAPLAAMIGFGFVAADPRVLWLLPALAAFSKALHDRFPNNTFVNWLPF